MRLSYHKKHTESQVNICQMESIGIQAKIKEPRDIRIQLKRGV